MCEQAKRGVGLRGHGFDLKDWEENFRAPFDPWIERLQEEYVLRSSTFDGLAACRTGQKTENSSQEQENK
jgi:hypothetical protein